MVNENVETLLGIIYRESALYGTTNRSVKIIKTKAGFLSRRFQDSNQINCVGLLVSHSITGLSKNLPRDG